MFKTNNNNNNTRTLNITITSDQLIIELYTFPFIVIIGTICNILIFLVMTSKKMRHQSTYFYMGVLAIADEMVLLNGCLNVWIIIYFGESLLFTQLGCKIVGTIYYTASHFSVWIVVAMTIERFIAVAIPLQANRLCTVKRAKLVCFSLACIMLLINIHFLFTHALINGECVHHIEYDLIMKIWPWIDAVIYSYIPLTLLIIFNILIVHNLIKSKKNIKRLQNGQNGPIKNYSIRYFIYSTFNNKSNNLSNQLELLSNQPLNQRQQQQQTSSSANKRLTIMLLVVSITFFVTSVPIVTLQTIERNYQQISNLVVLKGIFLALQYLNHSINFFLYAVTGKTFRKEFLALFVFVKENNHRNDFSSIRVNKNKISKKKELNDTIL
jgi:hypothetical protein